VNDENERSSKTKSKKEEKGANDKKTKCGTKKPAETDLDAGKIIEVKQTAEKELKHKNLCENSKKKSIKDELKKRKRDKSSKDSEESPKVKIAAHDKEDSELKAAKKNAGDELIDTDEEDTVNDVVLSSLGSRFGLKKNALLERLKNKNKEKKMTTSPVKKNGPERRKEVERNLSENDTEEEESFDDASGGETSEEDALEEDSDEMNDFIDVKTHPEKRKKKRTVDEVLKDALKNPPRGKSKGAKSKTSLVESVVTDDIILSEDPSPWDEGSHVPYAALCDTFVKIEEVSSRLQIQDILTRFLRRVSLMTF